MTQFTVSVNFRDTDVFASQDGNVVWNAKLNEGAVDWIFVLLNALRVNHNLLIGRLSAEFAIREIGSAMPLTEELTRVLRGRNLLTSEPMSLELSSIQMRTYCPIGLIFGLKTVFKPLEFPKGFSIGSSEMPEFLRTSLTDHPIILTGEFGVLKGLRQALEEAIKLPVVLGDDADTRPGAGKHLDDITG